MTARLKTAVLGATGYSGLELKRLLARHPRVQPPLLLRRSGAGQTENPAQEVSAGNGNEHAPSVPFSWSQIEEQGIELLFLATPHEVSRDLVPEFNGDQIPDAALVANPGCYATSVILALAPLLAADFVDREHGIISDSKSGVSGAGKEPTARTHFVAVADNLSAYSVFGHRHTGEILEQLKLASSQLIFTPHLLPIPRGILSTIYVHLNREMTSAEIETCFREFYRGRPWVRVFAASNLPQISNSLYTNYCDLGFCLAGDGRRLILVSCLDNLLKGAAGQAVQNMNLMYGWGEEEGLA